MNRLRSDDGMVTAFVVTITTVLILMAGLVLDGGNVLAAKRQAINIAEQAALAGAQGVNVSSVRTGEVAALDPAAATVAAQTYLRQVDADGTVSVTGNQVTVRVTIRRPMLILGLAGMRPVQVVGSATARNARGVTTGDRP